MINSQKKTVGRRSKTCLDLIRRMQREKREKKKLKEQHIINGSTNIKVQGENEAIEVEV